MGNGGRIGSNIDTVRIFHKFAERFFSNFDSLEHGLDTVPNQDLAGNLDSLLFRQDMTGVRCLENKVEVNYIFYSSSNIFPSP